MLWVDLAEEEGLNYEELSLFDLGTDGGWFNDLFDRAVLGFNLLDPFSFLN
jgi:hypothetical protein